MPIVSLFPVLAGPRPEGEAGNAGTSAEVFGVGLVAPSLVAGGAQAVAEVPSVGSSAFAAFGELLGPATMQREVLPVMFRGRHQLQVFNSVVERVVVLVMHVLGSKQGTA